MPFREDESIFDEDAQMGTAGRRYPDPVNMTQYNNYLLGLDYGLEADMYDPLDPYANRCPECGRNSGHYFGCLQDPNTPIPTEDYAPRDFNEPEDEDTTPSIQNVWGDLLDAVAVVLETWGGVDAPPLPPPIENLRAAYEAVKDERARLEAEDEELYVSRNYQEDDDDDELPF